MGIRGSHIDHRNKCRNVNCCPSAQACDSWPFPETAAKSATIELIA
ncbi:uncharacterized protein G2W53_000410 [Senna tora]|uniref:Uncharacterized protein n=1 Tax=Senna tora TaxID=362788 RepID=A0A834XDQ5_9FABA|nr:uncharacterized protein G2W53_000410 [Senna tora]